MAGKAQVGMELIATLVVIFIILVVITIYSIEKAQESNDLKTFIDAKRICSSVANNLDAIQQQGEGYYKQFSIPDNIQGNFEYNITIGSNSVEMSWNEKAWIANTMASNVTVTCLSYGLNETNRIWNRGSYLEVSCHRPNIRPIEDSVEYWNDNGNVTLSVEFENEGHIDAGAFNVSVDSHLTEISNLQAYEKLKTNTTIPNFNLGGYTVVIKADFENAIEETLESDNEINKTITI